MADDIGLDLGTATILIYGDGKILLEEPSVVAVNTYTGQVLAVGSEAYDMIGKTPDRIRAVRPLADGVISDYEMTQQMIRYFLKKVSENNFFKPRVAVCVPSGITNVESRAVVEAAVTAGARKVFLIEEPVASAIGLGLDISQPNGQLIIDIGGGTTDVAVLSLYGVVTRASIKVAGNRFDEAVSRILRTKFGLLVGDKMAEKVKMELGTVTSREEGATFVVKGRNILNGLPGKREVSWKDFVEPLTEYAVQIYQVIQSVLERTPPELVGDILVNGALMTGGGAMLHGLGPWLSERLHIQVNLAEKPVECVAIGTGKSFAYLDKLHDGFVETSSYLQ